MSVLGLVCTAAAFAHPFAGRVGDNATSIDGQTAVRLNAGVASVQYHTVQLDGETRAANRGNREHRAQNPVVVPTAAIDPRWLDVEEEMRLFHDEHVRFPTALAAREVHAEGECLESP